MVLGVDWLAMFSPMEFDFKGLSVRFKKGKQQVELKGEGNQVHLRLIKGSRLHKWARKQAYGILAQLKIITDEVPDTEIIPSEMERVLQEFEDVFREPKDYPLRGVMTILLPLKRDPSLSRSGHTDAPMSKRLKLRNWCKKY